MCIRDSHNSLSPHVEERSEKNSISELIEIENKSYVRFPKDFIFVGTDALWACGRGDVSTPSFGSHLNPISTREADYAHPIYVCPHQVLKATGAPVLLFTPIYEMLKIGV